MQLFTCLYATAIDNSSKSTLSEHSETARQHAKILATFRVCFGTLNNIDTVFESARDRIIILLLKSS